MTTLFALSLLAAKSFLGSQVIGSEDVYAGLLRLIGLVHVWQDGQFAARWLPDINFGYGYSLFNFYPPLFYYVAAGLFFIVRDFLLAANLTIVLSFFLSGVGMYYLARDFFGRPGALLSAVAFIFAPFHLCDIYRRTAFAQMFAYIFLPFVIFYINRVFARLNAAAFIGLALSVTGLILSHNITMILFFPVAIAYAFFLFFIVGPTQRSGLAWVLLAVACALGITTYYWLPANLEMKYVTNSNIYGGLGDYHQHFMSLYHLIFAPWKSGPLGQGMGPSFQLGWVHLILVGSSFLAFFKIWRVDINRTWIQIFWLLAAAVLGFMTLDRALPVWDAIPVLKYVQFPWRIFVAISFCISFLAGGFVLWVDGRLRWLLAVAASLFLIVVSVPFEAPINPMRSYDIKDPQQFLYNTRPMDSKGFLPVWVKAVPLKPPDQRYEVARGVAVITSARQVSSSRHEFHVNAATQSILCFHQFYFLGWKVTVDKKETAIVYDNPWGLILFQVPPGEHDVKIFLGQTPLRLMAGVLSWVSLLFLAGLAFYLRSRRSLSAGNLE